LGRRQENGAEDFILNKTVSTSVLLYRTEVFFYYKSTIKFKFYKKYLQNNSKRTRFFLFFSLQKDCNISKDNFCNTRVKQLHLLEKAWILTFI